MKVELVGYSFFTSKAKENKPATDYVALHCLNKFGNNVIGVQAVQYLVANPKQYFVDFSKKLETTSPEMLPATIDIEFDNRGWVVDLGFVK